MSENLENTARLATLKELLDKRYEKKNILFTAENPTISFAPPPFDKNTPRLPPATINAQYNTGLMLFPDYLLYLTLWTPNDNERAKLTMKYFAKSFASEALSDITRGVSAIITEIGGVSLFNKKETIQALTNPISLIIPIADITTFEKMTHLEKYLLGKTEWIVTHIIANHHHEGLQEIYLIPSMKPQEGAKFFNTLDGLRKNKQGILP